MKVSQRSLADDIEETLPESLTTAQAKALANYLSDRYHVVEKVGYNLHLDGRVAIDDDDVYPIDESITTLILRAQRLLTLAQAARQKVLDENIDAVNKLAGILFSTSTVSATEARNQAIELVQSGVTIP